MKTDMDTHPKDHLNLQPKEAPMFDKMFAAVKSDLTEFTNIFNAFSEFVESFSTDYVEGGSARDDALDAIIQYLEQMKTEKKPNA